MTKTREDTYVVKTADSLPLKTICLICGGNGFVRGPRDGDISQCAECSSTGEIKT